MLEYPLLDLDERIYTGPEHLPRLTETLKSQLRELQRRWSAAEERVMAGEDGPDADVDDAFEGDLQAVQLRLRRELAGTGWSLVPMGAKTDAQRRRKRKRKRH